jgi:hypothetical protein
MVVTITNMDGALPLAKRRLADGVHAIADPVPVAMNGVYHWQDPIYTELRAALRGGKTGGRTGTRRSLLPCRVDVLALVCEVDTTVGGWAPDAKGTIERLHQLAARTWRPMDCDLLTGYADQLERWCLTASGLITQHPRVFLEVPCPRCQARFAYRRRDGESVRTRALRLDEDGCGCGSCGAFWGPDRFAWLAKLLGCPALPGAETGP